MININFTEEEIRLILEEYYGKIDDDEFCLDNWDKREIKTAILNR